MGRRTKDINKGAIMAITVVSAGAGLASGSFWIFLLALVAQYLILSWLRIIR